jgi:hypothetical protein
MERVAREVEMVVSSLSPIAGERTVWLDPYGRLWHGAPGQGLPHDRWRTIGTFCRPSRDAVTTAILGVLRGAESPTRTHAVRPTVTGRRPELRAP